MASGSLTRSSRILIRILAVLLIANLLHSPSLTASAASIDCATTMDGGDHHGHGGGDDEPPGDPAKPLTLHCPFANTVATPVIAPVAVLRGFAATMLVPSPGPALIAASPDREDPPPRSALS